MNYVIFLSGNGACSRVSQLAGRRGRLLALHVPAPRPLSGSPNHEENTGSSQRGKENERWLLFPVPPPSQLPQGRMRPQLCRGSAVHGAGEMWGGSKAPEPLSQPPGEPLPGSRLCGTWGIPRIRANGGGLRPPALGGAVKDRNERRELLDGTGAKLSWARLGCSTPHPRSAPQTPLGAAEEQPGALSPSPHGSPRSCGEREHLGPCWHPWQAPGRAAGDRKSVV